MTALLSIPRWPHGVVPPQSLQQPFRRVGASVPVPQIEVPPVVEIDVQALHAAFVAGTGALTGDAIDVDGLLVGMYLRVVVQFVAHVYGLQRT
jgi:hypothetical protein